MQVTAMCLQAQPQISRVMMVTQFLNSSSENLRVRVIAIDVDGHMRFPSPSQANIMRCLSETKAPTVLERFEIGLCDFHVCIDKTEHIAHVRYAGAKATDEAPCTAAAEARPASQLFGSLAQLVPTQAWPGQPTHHFFTTFRGMT